MDFHLIALLSLSDLVSSIVNLNILSIEWYFYIILETKTLCFSDPIFGLNN